VDETIHIYTYLHNISEKCKGCPVTCQHAQREGIEGGEWSAPNPGRLVPRKRLGDYGAGPGRGSGPV